MKVFTAGLAALLLVAICSPAEAIPSVSDMEATSCCFGYARVRIPRSFIASTYVVSSRCPLPAVVLVTRKGRNMCADPQEAWVQNYLEHLETLKK